jgi:hypothetical protein
MKARVKATGEIVEVYQSSYNAGEFYDTETGTETYDVSELELLGTIIPIATEETPDYWTRLEHQYAGMAMQGLVTRGEVLGVTKQEIAIEIADISDIIAHALVEKMKEEKA